MSLGVVVLAAGEGKRLKSRLPKVLHRALNKPLLDWVLAAVTPLPASTRVVVVGHRREEVMAHLAGRAVQVVVQDPPLGTGDAFRVALPALAGCQRALVLPGDAPAITSESLQRLLQLQQEERAAAACLTAVLPDGGAYGRILRRHGRVVGIVEAKDATAEQLALREVNAGMYVFHLPAVAQELPRLSRENQQGEYYLTDVVAGLVRRGEKVVALTLDDWREMLGVNTRGELAQVSRLLADRVLRRWQEAGVTVVDPTTTWIDDDCQLAADTVLEPGVILRAGTNLGEGCWIGAYSVLEGVSLPAETRIPPLTYLKGGR